MVGRVHPAFEDQLTRLRALAAAAGAGTPGWWLPPASAWSGDVLDVPGMAAAFDRSAVGADYAEALTTDGTAATAASLRVQNDYVAALERAFRARHRGPVRDAAHAAARHRGHGAARGVYDAALAYAKDLLGGAP
jgi:hypothetical protein